MDPTDRLIAKSDFSDPFSAAKAKSFQPRKTFENWATTQSDSLQSSPTPLDFLKNFASGKGFSTGDETGNFNINPDGNFILNSSKGGWSITGNPAMKSLGTTLPITLGGNKGSISLEGSWNQQDPYGRIGFQFGSKPKLVDPESAAMAAVNNMSDPLGLIPNSQPDASFDFGPSPGRKLYEQMIRQSDSPTEDLRRSY